jgi:hypothetical protein
MARWPARAGRSGGVRTSAGGVPFDARRLTDGRAASRGRSRAGDTVPISPVFALDLRGVLRKQACCAVGDGAGNAPRGAVRQSGADQSAAVDAAHSGSRISGAPSMAPGSAVLVARSRWKSSRARSRQARARRGWDSWVRSAMTRRAVSDSGAWDWGRHGGEPRRYRGTPLPLTERRTIRGLRPATR